MMAISRFLLFLCVIACTISLTASDGLQCANRQTSDVAVTDDDPMLQFQVAVYVDSKFVCSGVTYKNKTVITGASCVSQLTGVYLFQSTTVVPLNKIKILIGQRTITPTLTSESQAIDIVDAQIDQSFILPSTGINKAKLWYAGDEYPSPTPVEENLKRDTKLLVYGWASGTGAAHCSINRNDMYVSTEQQCKRKRVEFCADYQHHTKHCTADTGSPIYLKSASGPPRVAGIVTNVFTLESCEKALYYVQALNSTMFVHDL
jgi:hypothetical protein